MPTGECSIVTCQRSSYSGSRNCDATTSTTPFRSHPPTQGTRGTGRRPGKTGMIGKITAVLEVHEVGDGDERLDGAVAGTGAVPGQRGVDATTARPRPFRRRRLLSAFARSRSRPKN